MTTKDTPAIDIEQLAREAGIDSAMGGDAWIGELRNFRAFAESYHAAKLEGVGVEPIGHLHSNMDFCQTQTPILADWPLDLYSAAAVAALQSRIAELEALLAGTGEAQDAILQVNNANGGRIKALEGAVADEREACAKLCDAEFWHATRRDGEAAGVAAGNCAAAIRARAVLEGKQ